MERNTAPRYNGRVRDSSNRTVQTIEIAPMRPNMQKFGKIDEPETYDLPQRANKREGLLKIGISNDIAALRPQPPCMYGRRTNTPPGAKSCDGIQPIEASLNRTTPNRHTPYKLTTGKAAQKRANATTTLPIPTHARNENWLRHCFSH